MKRIRLPKWLKAAEGEPCVMCGADDGTTVAAHMPRSGITGDGIAVKAHDFCIAFLCATCHMDFDSVYRKNDYLRYKVLVRTWERLHERGLL